MDFRPPYIRTMLKYWIFAAMLLGLSNLFEIGSQGDSPKWLPEWFRLLAQQHGDAFKFWLTTSALWIIVIRGMFLTIQRNPGSKPVRDISMYWIIFALLSPMLIWATGSLVDNLQIITDRLAFGIMTVAGILLTVDMFFIGKFKNVKKGGIERFASDLFLATLIMALLGGICALLFSLLWMVQVSDKFIQYSLIALSLQVTTTIIYIFYPDRYFSDMPALDDQQ